MFKLLSHETELARQFVDYIPTIEKPDIDAIAVTTGPGLEPALWVGINFAKALGIAWNIPVYPVNHMEGHILSVLTQTNEPVQFPALSLLISGGHTELVLMNDWQSRQVIGETKDDAIGEAFDKVARILSLPYPGGPEISKLAKKAREENITSPLPLPRPMLRSGDYSFSFSGLKTAVLYGVQKMGTLTDNDKLGLAREFEDAVTEVIITKTQKAIDEFIPKTLIIGGGVVANTHIRESFEKLIAQYGNITLLLPETTLATDNSVMIAIAGYLNILSGKQSDLEFKAQGNLRLG
jgi:N6-L-threonylcarbamoyladenine synthase